MTVNEGHRVLIISSRSLVAEGITTLLESLSEIKEVTVAASLYDARHIIRQSLPDALVIDLPAGADYFIDRPMEVGGREIKTIVVQDNAITGHARMYVYNPAVPANLQNLAEAIISGPSSDQPSMSMGYLKEPAEAICLQPASPRIPQPTSLIRARESGPSSLDISSSKRGL